MTEVSTRGARQPGAVPSATGVARSVSDDAPRELLTGPGDGPAVTTPRQPRSFGCASPGRHCHSTLALAVVDLPLTVIA
jgi:hypothetical protein